MLYAILAQEGSYEGLHGIESTSIIEADSYEEACEYGEQESLRLIETYGLEPPYEEGYEDILDEQIRYYVYSVPNSKGMKIEELEKMFFDEKEEFFKKFCKEI